MQKRTLPKHREKHERRILLSSSFRNKITISRYKNISLYEIILKSFIRTILWFVIPKKNKLNKNKNEELINLTYSKISSREFAFIPASTSFTLFISFIPIIAILLGMLRITATNLDSQFISLVLSKIIPGFSNDYNVWSSDSTPKITVFVIFFFSALWLGASGFANIIYTQSYIYSHKTFGNYLTNKLKGFFLVLIISITLYLSAVSYLGIVNIFGIANEKWSSNILLFFWIAITLFIIISLIFKFGPKFKLTWKQIAPGLLLATAPIVLITSVFGGLGGYLKYDKFGILGAILYLLLYIFIFVYLVYLGIITNAAFLKTYFTTKTDNKFNIWNLFHKIKR